MLVFRLGLRRRLVSRPTADINKKSAAVVGFFHQQHQAYWRDSFKIRCAKSYKSNSNLNNANSSASLSYFAEEYLYTPGKLHKPSVSAEFFVAVWFSSTADRNLQRIFYKLDDNFKGVYFKLSLGLKPRGSECICCDAFKGVAIMRKKEGALAK